MKREATQHSAIEAWMRHYLKTHQACAVELKHTRGKATFPLSEIAEHQDASLTSFERKEPFVYKFDDTGYRKKPFDFIGVAGGDAFVAIRFPKTVYIIAVDKLLTWQKRTERLSIRAEEASPLASGVIHID